MKTSIYLIAAFLMPTTSYAYNFELYQTEASTEQRVTKGGATVPRKVYQGAGNILFTPHLDLVWGPELPLGGTVTADATTKTQFWLEGIPEQTYFVSLMLPGPVYGGIVAYNWDVKSMQAYSRPTTMIWGNADKKSIPRYQLECNLPPSVVFDQPIAELDLYFAAEVMFSSAIATDALSLDVNCTGKYVMKPDLKVVLKDETIRLSGVTGVPVHKASAVLIDSDPGRVRLTIINEHKNELTVSFEEDQIQEQTDVTFPTKSKQTIPFYVRTRDTTAGVRSYAVQLAATYL